MSRIRLASTLLSCLLLACSSSSEPTSAQHSAASSPSAERPTPAEPKPIEEPKPKVTPKPLPTEWLPIPGKRDIQDLGRLRDFGAFIAGDNQNNVRWVLKLEADGSETLYSPGSGQLDAVAEAENGDLLLAGKVGEEWSTTPWFARMNASGELVAEATYPTDVGGDDWIEVIPYRDGAVLLGVYNPLTSGVSHSWALAVDATGKVVWDQRLGEAGYHYFAAGVTLPDGGVMALGAGKRDNYSPWLAAIDKDGKVTATTLHETKPFDGLHTAALGSDGAVYAAGTSTAEQGSGFAHVRGRLQVIKASASGKVEWEHVWLEGIVIASSMIALPDGGVLLLAATIDEDASPKNPEGELLLVRVAPDGSEPRVTDIAVDAVALTFTTAAAEIVGIRGSEVVLLQLRRQAGKDDAYEWRFAAQPL